MTVEGQTEQAFLSKLLSHQFSQLGLDLSVKTVGEPGRKGGNLNLDRVLRDLSGLLKQEPKSVVTTCFDYYDLPWDFARAAKKKPAKQAVAEIESELTNKVAGKFGPSFNASRFVPYIQLHEIEALFFAEPEVVAGEFGAPSLAARLERVVDECGGCEAINDHYETKPSKRLENMPTGYRKGASSKSHAPRIAGRMNLATVRSQCPHFDAWLRTLEGFGTA